MRSYRPGAPLVFSHIPKTAGTSLGTALEQVLQPGVVVRGIDTSLFGGYDDVDALAPVLRPGIFLSAAEIPGDAGLVAGHIAPATTEERFPGADHITVLRTPQVRLLSQWLHSRSLSEFSLRHWGPSADAFRAGRRPLKEYLVNDLVAPSVDNTITRFLAFPHPALGRRQFITDDEADALVQTAVERLDGFSHVNLVENRAFLDDLSAWLGTDLPRTQLNERTSVPPEWRPDLAAELDDETRELLDHRCRLDVKVWKHVAARVLPADADHDAVLAEAFEGAVERYDAMLRRPYDAGRVRRTVERAWDVGTTLPVVGPALTRPGGSGLTSALQQVQQVRRVVPVAAVPGLVERRLERLWENDAFRRSQIGEMEFLVGRSERAGEVEELARAYTEQMMIRSYMRWHPREITTQRVKGIERLIGRDRSRGTILSFMHHHRYEGLFGSLVNAGGPPQQMVITEGITKPEAGIAFAQHLRVCARGGTFLIAEHGTRALAEALRPGAVVALAPDFPGRTPATFLGRKVLAPFGTPRLASMTDSQIILVTHRRDEVGPYVQVEEPIEPADFPDPAVLLQEILDRHGEAVLDWPEALESPRARFGAIPEESGPA